MPIPIPDSGSYSGRGNRSDAIYDRSYQDWHQRPSLMRPEFELIKGATAVDVDLFAVEQREAAPEGEPFSSTTLIEVEGRENAQGRVKNLPQVLMITEAKCFDRYPVDAPPKVADFTCLFGVEVQQALAKAAAVPLYLIGYRHFQVDIPATLDKTPSHLIPESRSADIEWFYVAQAWPQAKLKFKRLGAKEYAQSLVKRRQQLVAFNVKAKDLRSQIHKLIDQWQDLFGEEFKQPHPPATPIVPGVAYVDPGNELLRANGYQDRTPGSKGVRSYADFETATILPSPAPMPFSPVTASLGPPPTLQVETATQKTVETRILPPRETRGGGRPPSGETR